MYRDIRRAKLGHLFAWLALTIVLCEINFLDPRCGDAGIGLGKRNVAKQYDGCK
jgi:hypothetical protein